MNPDSSSDHWDVITATMNGGVIWRRYSDGLIVVTRGADQPQEKPAEEETSEHRSV